MKVVIAGASGLIGRQLLSCLARDGHDAVVLGADWDAASVANAGAVVDLSRQCQLDSINDLVDAMASLPPADRPRAFLAWSSAAIYDGDSPDAITEATPVGRSAHARGWCGREAAAFAAEVLAVRVVTLRCGLIVPGGAHLVPALVARRLLGRSATWLPWVGLEDVVRLVVRAAHGWDIEGPLNVVAPQPVLVPRGAGLRAPGWVRRAATGGNAELLFESRHVWPVKALKASYLFRQPSMPEVACRALGLPPAAGGYVIGGSAVVQTLAATGPGRLDRRDPSSRSSARAA